MTADQTPHGPPPAGGEPPRSPLPPPPGPEPRRLYRSRHDRMIGGVCGGLARHLGVDPVIVRVATVALVFVGGAAALAYLAALVLVPEEPLDGDAPLRPAARRGPLAIIGGVVLVVVAAPLLIGAVFVVGGILLPLALLALVGLVVWWLASGKGASHDPRELVRGAALGLGLLAICGVLFVASGWAAGLGGVPVAAVVIGLGVVLVGASFVGGARWLILPALSIALPLALVSAADVDLHGGIGERSYRPASAAEVHDRYQLGIGELTVDLRDVALPAGDHPLKLRVGMGQADLIVPDDVCVASRARVGAGEARVLERESAGVDVDREETPAAPLRAGRLVVDAQVGLGQLRVRRAGGAAAGSGCNEGDAAGA